MLPCIIFEDEHLLVVNKPAGLNTHAPDPFAGEGIYDWLKHREPRWAQLAIIHRLDKETSGVMVFGKTSVANRSLTEQFTRREVQKKYILLTDRPMGSHTFVARSKIARAGDRYVSNPRGEPAETRFETQSVAGKESIKLARSESSQIAGLQTIAAWPLTGRTHQIRVHAAENGFPILGDRLYGGSPFARVCLHAEELSLRHPGTGIEMTFRAPADFASDAREALRTSLIDPRQTTSFRLVHGASDGWPGWYLDRLGDYLLSQSENELTPAQRRYLESQRRITGVYHKILNRQVRRTDIASASPQLEFGEPAPERFSVLENGVQFELSFNEGYSVGLFLDQRDNRRRLLTGHSASGFELWGSDIVPKSRKLEVLNTFAYTCGFSVCAARSGARVTSLDLSRKYLDWGRRNFSLNQLDPGPHDFIYGDAFDWMRRLAKKGRTFDLLLLDPPTFSQSKAHGTFRAEKNYGELMARALPLLKPGGVLFASTNAADWAPADFVGSLEDAIRAGKRSVSGKHYAPQPPDFPVSREEPAHLKTVWLRIN